jgi:hypothetical protein
MAFTKLVNISNHTHGADKNIKGKARILRKKMTDYSFPRGGRLGRGSKKPIILSLLQIAGSHSR